MEENMCNFFCFVRTFVLCFLVAAVAFLPYSGLGEEVAVVIADPVRM